MSLDCDVPIKYTNKTGQTDFSVVVFVGNQYGEGVTEVDGRTIVAYNVLRTQNTVQFTYPRNCAVSATYRQGGQVITAGPIPAEPGNCYEIVKSLKEDTAIIREVLTPYDPNPNGAITILNVRPKSWSGQLYDCELSKGGCTVLANPGVRAGNLSVFMLNSVLNFVVTRNAEIGQVISSWEMSDVFSVNLQKFPNGVEVILEEDEGSAYHFTAVNLKKICPE